jgi:hypothetical protein
MDGRRSRWRSIHISDHRHGGAEGLARMRAAARTVAQANDVLHYEADFTRLMVAYGDRMLVIDRLVADCWGEMLAQREANVMDTAIAATAMVHGLVVATRNVRHFRGRDVRVIDPFKAKPVVMYV